MAPTLLVMALTAWGTGRAFGDPAAGSSSDGSSNSDDVSVATPRNSDESSPRESAPGSAAEALAEARSEETLAARGAGPRHARVHRLSPDTKLAVDRSGRARVGKASFYAKMFAGRKMADGTPMRPTGNNAASLTLPLGTTAKVTNLQTGKTAIVTIRDRGPYVDGRIVDLSPATARQIGLDKRTGVTRVQVAPIAVPMPNGGIKLGDGALEASNRFAGNGEWDERAESGARTP